MFCKRGICRVYHSGAKVDTYIVDHTKVSISSVFVCHDRRTIWYGKRWPQRPARSHSMKLSMCSRAFSKTVLSYTYPSDLTELLVIKHDAYVCSE